jgi:hypothetical protein
VRGLPRGSKVVHAVPTLAEVDPARLSAAELELARYVHVILPAKTKLEDVQPIVAAWKCVAEVHRPPEISLP